MKTLFPSQVRSSATHAFGHLPFLNHPKRTLAALVAMSTLVLAFEASALVVHVGGTPYNVTTLTGAFDDNAGVLTQQPWFGNETLAQSFAVALGDQLGLPHDMGNSISDFLVGPMFAWTDSPASNNPNAFRAEVWVRSHYFGMEGGSWTEAARYHPYTFAILDSATHGVPDTGSTWLLLTAGTLGLTRLNWTSRRAPQR